MIRRDENYIPKIVLGKPVTRELVAVIYNNGVYRMYEGNIYRHTFTDYPLKKHRHTSFKDLEDLISQRTGYSCVNEDPVPVYAGDVVNIQF